MWNQRRQTLTSWVLVLSILLGIFAQPASIRAVDDESNPTGSVEIVETEETEETDANEVDVEDPAATDKEVDAEDATDTEEPTEADDSEEADEPAEDDEATDTDEAPVTDGTEPEEKTDENITSENTVIRPAALVQENLTSSFELSYNDESGNWTTVEDGSEHEVDLEDRNAVRMTFGFTKPNELDIAEGDTYIVDLPSFYSSSGTAPEIDITIEGEKVGTYSIVNNQLVITFTAAVNHFDEIEMHATLTGSFDVGVFDDEEEIVVDVPFQDGDSFTATIRAEQFPYDGKDKKVAGQAYVLLSDGTKSYTTHNATHIDWSLIANDQMNSYTNATIFDDLGEHLTIVEDSFVVERIIRNYKNEGIGRETIDVTPTFTTTGFEIDLGDIDDAYEISYTTEMTRPEGGGKHTLSNDARIVLDGDEKSVSDDYTGTWSGDLPVINKEGTSTDDPHVIDWTIEYNFGKEALGLVTLTDSLTHGDVDLSTVVVYEVDVDVDGNITNQTEVDVTPEQTENGMIIPNLDADGKAYNITFSSTVPVGLNDTIINTVTDDLPSPNSDDASVPVDTIPTGDKFGEQKIDDEGRPYIEWTITMNSTKVNVSTIDVIDVFNPEMLDFDATDAALYTLYKDGVAADNFNIEPYTHDDDRAGFQLKVTNAGPHEYKFIYKTYYTVAGMQQPELANDAELIFLDGDGVGIGEGLYPDFSLEGPKVGIHKTGKYVDNSETGLEEIEWTITFNESKILLNAGSTLTDVFDNTTQTLVKDSIQVSPELNSNTSTTANGFVLTLTEPTKETVTVTFITVPNFGENTEHTNNATLKWEGGEEKDNATVGKRDPGGYKEGEIVINPDGTKTVNWTVAFNTNWHTIHDFVLTDSYTPATAAVSNIKITGLNDEDVTGYFAISDAANGEFTVSANRLLPHPYYLTYSTTLSPAEEQAEIKNSVKITYEGGEQETEKTLPSPTLNVDKSAEGITKPTGDADYPVISWEITANSGLVNLLDAKLVDTIPADQRLIADSIKVVRVGGTDMTDGLAITTSDNEFTIELPDGAFAYTVSFETEALYLPTEHPNVFDRYDNDVELTSYPVANEPISDTDDAWIRYYDGVDNNLTGKTGVQNPESENIDYTLTINPDALTIHNAKIADTLSWHHSYVDDSIKIYDAADPETELTSGFTLTVEADKRSFEIVFDGGTIDSTYLIEYSTRLNRDLVGSYDVTNDIVLTGGTDGTKLDESGSSTDGQQWFYGGGGSGTRVEFKLKKEHGDYQLSGAVFKLERVRFDGSIELVDAEITTESDTVYVSGNIRAGRYILTETEAPEGFKSFNNPIYLMIGYAPEDSGHDYLVTIANSSWVALDHSHSHASADGNVLTVENDIETGNVVAHKVWGRLPAVAGSGVPPMPYGLPETPSVSQGARVNLNNLPQVYLELYRNLPGETPEAVPGAEPKAVSGSSASEAVTWNDIELYAATAEGAVKYEFSVKEVDVDGNDLTPDGYVKVEDGLNVYNLEVNPEVQAGKNLSGRPLRHGEFEFELKDAGGEVVATATNNAAGAIVFTDFLELTDAQAETLKNYEEVQVAFTISEVQGNLGGVSYDDATFGVEITLSVDETTGKLNTRTDYTDGLPTFRNEYEAGPTEATIEAHKNLSGQALEAGQFEFELRDVDGDVLETVENAADGSVTFAAIEYDAVGTYTYTVREVKGTLGGVDYDASVYVVNVLVTDDGNGELAADVRYTNGPASFTNSYTPAPDSVVLEAHKTLTGQTLTAGQFEFDLVDDQNRIVEKVSNNEDGDVVFSELTFDEVGEYRYTIREVKGTQGGVSYDEASFEFVVTVIDDGQGQLHATVAEVDGSAVFTNTYTPEAGSVVLEAHKTLHGQDLRADQFEFELLQGDDVVETSTNNAEGQVIFPELSYDSVGTYEYTIREVRGDQGGVEYDTSKYSVTVTVIDDGQGQLHATASYTNGPAQFDNTYTPEPDEVILLASKILEGQDLRLNQFEFELLNEQGHVIQSARNNAEGQVIFGRIVYDTVGEYHYTIREVEGRQGGVEYDPNTFGVTVTVTDDGEGQLTATPVYSHDDVVFTNLYTAAPDSVVLEADKVLEGKDLVADLFEFELRDANETVIQTVTNNRQGQVIFDEITYVEAGIYTYTIREVEGEQGGITYDDRVIDVTVTVEDDGEGQLLATVDYDVDEVVFTNTYTAAPVDVNLIATKNLLGQSLEDGQFKFELLKVRQDEDNEVIQTVENVGASVSFEALSFEAVGTYLYQIREVQGEQGGMTYDERIHNVVISVIDNGKGQLVANVNYFNGDPTFNNTYVAEPTEVVFEASKTLTGQDLSEGQFTFELLDGEGEVIETVVNDADGRVLFEAITYEQGDYGTYTYTIREVTGDQGGMTYDDAEYGITVVVSDDREGQVVAEVSYDDGEAEFTNEYVPAPVDLALEASKTLTGQDLRADQFTFELLDATGGIVDTQGNLLDGSVTFATITYDKVGEYRYTIREVEGTQGGVTYDKAEFAVVVTVTDDGVGQLWAVADYVAGPAEFNNSYEAAPVDLALEASKELLGRDHIDMVDGEFSFEVVDSNDEVVATGSNTATGEIVFESIEYTVVGEHVYTIREVKGADRNIQYDETEHEVTVIITDDGVGQLVAEAIYPEEGAVFTNNYEPLKVSVGDYVWEDVNRDGLQDETDIPIPGVVLVLKDLEGNLITEDVYGNPIVPQVTDDEGYYSFDDLYVDNVYVVEIDREASAEALEPFMPTIETEDNRENDSSTWTSTSVELTEDGQRDPTLDFGFVRPYVSVGDYVWEDVNRDGLQDETDIPLEGVELTITDQDGNPVTDVYGNPVGPTKTDEDGWYEFPFLPVTPEDGYYRVTVTPPAGFIPTIEVEGDRENDSSTDYADSTPLTEHEQHDPTLDFGFVRPAVSVGDYVWLDVNRDGIQDETDVPLEGVVLLLEDKDGNRVTDVFGKLVEPTKTDDKGWYEFAGLPVTDEGYVVRVVTPEGYVPTIDNAGPRDLDSDAAKGYAESVALPNDGDHDPTLDFGFVTPPYVSVGDYVWFDVNGDGLQDDTDIPLEGVKLTITDQDGNPVVDINGNPVGPTYTDEEGWYEFTLLPVTSEDGFYRVIVTAPEGYQSTQANVGDDNSIDSSTDYADSRALTEHLEHDPTLDFGFVRIPEPTPPPTEPTEPTPTPTEPTPTPTEPTPTPTEPTPTPTDPTDPVDPQDPAEPGDPDEPIVVPIIGGYFPTYVYYLLLLAGVALGAGGYLMVRKSRKEEENEEA